MIFESTLCCVAPRVGVRDSQSTLFCVAPRVGVRDFLGRKNGTLTARQQCYNDVHGWYRACIEQLFARLWHWGLFRNIWRGGPNELHQLVRILLHFTQFCIRRQVCHPPYGPWEHVPPHVWTD